VEAIEAAKGRTPLDEYPPIDNITTEDALLRGRVERLRRRDPDMNGLALGEPVSRGRTAALGGHRRC